MYRLVSEGSVEEKIQRLKAHKKELADAVVREQSGALSGLSEDDVRMLLSESDGGVIEPDPITEVPAAATAAAPPSKPARARRAAKK